MDWGGVKPSITYAPKDNRVKVSIGSLGGWVREEITTSLDKEEENKVPPKSHNVWTFSVNFLSL